VHEEQSVVNVIQKTVPPPPPPLAESSEAPERRQTSMTGSVYSTEMNLPRKWEVAKYIISALVMAFGIGAYMFIYSFATPPESQSSTALIQQVDTFEVQAYSGMIDLEVNGSVVPHREIRIAAEVAGRVQEKFPACKAGNFVTKGENLVKIDPEEYELEIKTLEADVLQSERRIEENEAQIAGEERNIELAKNDLEIQRQEFARNQRLAGVLSQSELDQSQRALNSAQAQLVTRQNSLSTLIAGTSRLNAALEFSKRQLERSRLNLRRTLIQAPADGVIVKENVQEGDYVAKGTQIVIFEDTQQAEVLVNLTPANLAWIRENAVYDRDERIDSPSVYRIPKTRVTIYDPSEPDVTWVGSLVRFDGIGRDEITKTIPARILIEDPVVETDTGPRALLRGMYVKCRVEVQTSTSDQHAPPLLSFPAVALHPNRHVWSVVDSKLKMAKIQVINRSQTMVNGDTREIVIAKSVDGQLSPGSAIVVSPLSQPTENATVILKQPVTATAGATAINNGDAKVEVDDQDESDSANFESSGGISEVTP